MVGMQNTNERLTLLKEVVAVGLEIETAFQDAVQRDFKDREAYDVPDEDLDDYFVYQFLHNALTHASSAIVLAENGFSKQLMLVARTILEGWFFFKSFMNTRPAENASPLSKKFPSAISKKWRGFHIYQLYQSERKSEGEVAAIRMLTDLEDRVGTGVVKQAEKQFDFQNEKEAWHKRGNLKALIEVDGDPRLLPLYESAYSVFSQVQHWDPLVVIATEIPSDMALGPIFHNIFRMILYINNFYNLKFEGELNDMYRRVVPLLFREVLPLT
jgi:hypothetical protein